MIHLVDHRGSGAFLWPEHGTASMFAAERIGHITGNAEGAFRKLRENVIIGDRTKVGETGGTEADLSAVFIQKSESKCLKHADPAIVGSASADPDNKMSASASYRIPDDLADTVGRCGKRISLFRGDQRDPGGTGHFDDRGLAFFEDAVAAGDWFPQRARNGNLGEYPAASGGEGFYRSFASVRKRADRDFGVRMDLLYSVSGAFACFHGCQASFERIDCDNNVHFVYAPLDE